MGGKDSSSKRKSSKRKRDKISSQKKNRRKESKKRSRVHVSVSSYSEDESSNSEHISSPASKSNHKRRIHKNKKLRRDYLTSSSSDDRSLSADSDSSSNEYKRKKASRSRVHLKITQKRARQRSNRPKGNGHDAQGGKKRKRLGRDDIVKPKKKSSKKKPKKHLNSSSSSEPESRSTSQSRSSSSKIILDNERERSRGRESYKSRKKRKIRSPSHSSCDRGSKLSVSVGCSDGAFSPVNNNNSRRLRSVIAVADQRHDEGENRWEKDPHKEEIVYDRNDYPSPKSLDSNEGENKMELDNQFRINEGNQDNDVDRHSEAVDMNHVEKGIEIETSVPVADLGGDVLESILRQKALENMKKFKERLQTGRTSTNLKMSDESNVNRSSDVMVDNVQNESPEQGNTNENVSELTEVKKLSDSENVEKEHEMATQTVEHPTEPVSRIDTCPGDETTNVESNSIAEPSSLIGTTSGELSLDRGNEAKHGSQFEQKTMSVMRGGEMVQVSYKVYIPKKAPALARRPLKR